MNKNQPNPTRAEREWQRRHRDIVNAATELFMEHGFAGTTMQMIAERAEYSVGYIYKHFPGKQELVDDIFHAQLEWFSDVRRTLREGPYLSPLDCFRKQLIVMAQHLAAHPGLLVIFKSAETTSPTPEKRAVFETFRREDIEQLREAQNAGEIAGGDPALIAATVDGVIHGLMVLMHESGQPERFIEIPNIVDELILAPLERAGTDANGKGRKNR
jgi:AcrR family transcriptional regulator